MTSARRRILFIGEAFSLAHISRLIVLAKTLDASRYEIHFAAPASAASRYVLDGGPFQTWTVTGTTEDRFVARLRRGLPLWTVTELEEAVRSDRDVLRKIRPDLVVSDLRVSMSTSAPLEGVRHATIVNAQWSTYAVPVRQPPPETMLSPYIPGFTQRYFDLVRPLAFWLYTRPINRLRRRHGLKSFGSSTGRALYGADDVLYVDPPGIVRMRTQLPANHRFLGAPMWSPDVALPPWWDDLSPDRPLIYVSLGSTGKLGALPTILRALRDAPYRVAAAVGGRAATLDVPANAHVAPYLPGDALARRATIVIGNGGSPGLYQALAEGRPVLGVPHNIDQHMCMAAVEQFGATLSLRSDWLSARAIRRSVERLVEEPAFSEAAAAAATLIRDHPVAESFPRYVEETLG